MPSLRFCILSGHIEDDSLNNVIRRRLFPRAAASRTRIPVCSTTRVKSATVFSLMVDGSGSRGCRIFGRLRSGEDGEEACSGQGHRTRLLLLGSSTWCVGAERGPTIA